MRKLFIAAYVILIAGLIFSAILSGYHYRFDNDELYHLQKVYLITKGYTPYKQFYSVYAPFLHWLLVPIYKIVSFGISTLEFGRLVMIMLFSLRVVITTYLASMIFGKRAIFFLLPLLLMEPFTIFSGMQIRPENLALVFFLIFLVLLFHGIKRSSNRLFFICGIFFSLCVLSSLKIAPAVSAVTLVFYTHLLRKRLWSAMIFFADGAAILSLIFFLILFIQGGATAGFQQLLLDPFLLNKSIRNPTPFYFFYIMESSLLYGRMGKPITWIIAMILPLIAFAGGYQVLKRAVAQKLESAESVISLGLFFAMSALFFALLLANSVWMQYYVPITWLYCFFAAYLLSDLLKSIDKNHLIKFIYLGGLIIVFLSTAHITIEGNIQRSGANHTVELDIIQKVWQDIPEDGLTFPNMLFRRPIYPIIYGGTLSPFMIERFGPIYKSIEQVALNNLYPLSDDYYSYLDVETKQYINTHYKRDETNPLLWKRIK